RLPAPVRRLVAGCLRLLASDDPDKRERMVFLLAQGGGGGLLRLCVRRLIRRLNSDDETIPREAAVALEALGQAVIDPLGLELIRSKDPGFLVRGIRVFAAIGFSGRLLYLAAFARLLASQNTAVRDAAGRAFLEL